jgi:hypothetical protein
LRIEVHRCVQQADAHLTFTIGARWVVTFEVGERRFQCTVAELCEEVRSCSTAARSGRSASSRAALLG